MGLRVRQWRCALAVGTGERANPPFLESSRGRGVSPPPTRSVIPANAGAGQEDGSKPSLLQDHMSLRGM